MKDFKVRCIDNKGNYHVEGKIYKVTNGVLETEKHCGENTEIYKSVEEINNDWCSQFELMEEEKMFAKSDLKTGMVVELKNGIKYLVLLGTEFGDYLINNEEQDSMKIFENDLKSNDGDSQWDVVKVYKPTHQHQMRQKAWGNMELLWERKEEPIEITIEEIAKLKGVSADRIRIKE